MILIPKKLSFRTQGEIFQGLKYNELELKMYPANYPNTNYLCSNI
jgi:hypothetical protein